MQKIKVSKSVFPNSFTALNAFCGFASIVYASKGDFTLAAGLILVAAIFDSLDGMMARLTNSASEFGVQLDSLVDCVSFGAAPAFLIYQAHLYKFELVGLIISSLLLIFGAFRLARFNVQLTGFEKDYFVGLPIPFQAITIGAFVYGFHTPGFGFPYPYDNFAIPLVVLLAILMVSKIKYPIIPKPTVEEIKENPFTVIYILLAVIILPIVGYKYTFFALLIFIVLSFVLQLFKLLMKSNK